MAGRTLVVTNDFPPRTGGIESFVLAVASRLPPGEVVVHTARQPGDREHDAGLAFPVVRDPARLLVPTPAVVARVARTAREHGCDRVWFGAAAPLALMAPALRRAGVRRVVATTHGHETWWASLPVARTALRAVGDRVDVLTALGPWCAARVARPLSARGRSRLQRLVPGVDAEVFRPGAGGGRVRRELGLEGRPVVVCVSRMVARKGQDVLVRALPAVLAREPDAVLLLVGDGPGRRRVERLVRRLSVCSSVVLAGRVPWARTAEHYAAGDVFAVPTRTRLLGLEPEALGICYLEAAASGLPVVVGDSGGAPDAVLPGRTGVVVDGRDGAAVADALVGLLRDPARARAWGAEGRRWVSAAWSWEGQVERLRVLLDPSVPVPDGPDPALRLPPAGRGGRTRSRRWARRARGQDA
ncbi:glycosyltransferase family 4 protein [uncultured Pseudokineococcus sp.]|uniref:glycosyltransferase family 4 protein n=1 Tax=uncultured Pseudokineococcus sp. TaxID=1642928 RepID=UPI00262B9BD0|nr:glycosyltransferase family 4 protein [uncultured Pseudokineococcus sp.]